MNTKRLIKLSKYLTTTCFVFLFLSSTLTIYAGKLNTAVQHTDIAMNGGSSPFKSLLSISENIISESNNLAFGSDMHKIYPYRTINRSHFFILSLMFLFAALAFISTYIIFKIKDNSAIEKALAVQQKIYFESVMKAQERERKKVAGYLHDNLGQLLSLIKLNMSEFSENFNSNSSENTETLNRSLEIIDQACEEVRSISNDLMPGSLIRLGLISASRDLIRKINSLPEVYAKISSDVSIDRFDENLEIAFFRILQELTDNSIIHSKATAVEVNFTLENKILIMTLKYNGSKIDVLNIDENMGGGWKNINSRLSLINGNYKLSEEKEWSNVITVSAKAYS